MAERSSLRGSRLGATSYEDERRVEFAERQVVAYDCSAGHRFEVPFSTEAEVPALWECPRCGAQALRLQTDRPEEKTGKPARTHWDMLLERRSIEELEVLLDERLDLLRSGRLGSGSRFAQASTSRSSSRRKSA
ncbi:MAG TPA: RNA polymerase-binding protein RbpA [Jiangellales bacterium]|nr:RNA polymerase-binding protein RbpA [Jiangellales bacterium]